LKWALEHSAGARRPRDAGSPRRLRRWLLARAALRRWPRKHRTRAPRYWRGKRRNGLEDRRVSGKKQRGEDTRRRAEKRGCKKGRVGDRGVEAVEGCRRSRNGEEKWRCERQQERVASYRERDPHAIVPLTSKRQRKGGSRSRSRTQTEGTHVASRRSTCASALSVSIPCPPASNRTS